MLKQITEQLAFAADLFMDRYDLALTTGYKGEHASAKKKNWTLSYSAEQLWSYIRDWVDELREELIMKAAVLMEAVAWAAHDLKIFRVQYNIAKHYPASRRLKKQLHAIGRFHALKARVRIAKRRHRDAYKKAEALAPASTASAAGH